MSGEIQKDQAEKVSQSKATEEQSSVWADIARDMAIGAAVGSTAGPLGTIIGTELGLGWGLLTHAQDAVEAAKQLAESARQLAENPVVQKAIKDSGRPISASPETMSLFGGLADAFINKVKEVGEDVVDHFKLHPERAIPELLVPPLLIYDAITPDD
ncbi:MAG TPA: hypothetical protein V6D08_12505 [Candidatus Obscuribacterales bacterium]